MDDTLKQILDMYGAGGDDPEPKPDPKQEPDGGKQADGGKEPDGGNPPKEPDKPQDGELSDDDIAFLLEQGLSEKELSEKTEEEIKKLVSEKKGQQKQPSPNQLIVSEDLANQVGGIAKSFVGKPVQELFTALTEQNSYIGKLSAELQNTKRQLLELQMQIQQQTKTGDEGKNAAKFMEQNKQLEIQKAVEEALKTMLPSLQELQQASIEKRQQEILQSIEQKLGDKYRGKAADIAKEFAQVNEITEADVAFYEMNPQRFIRDVIDYVRLKETREELERIKSQKSYEQKLEIARKIRAALRKSPEGVKETGGAAGKDIDPTLRTVRQILEE